MPQWINNPVLTELRNALKLGQVPDSPEAIQLLDTVQPVVLIPDWRLIGVLVSGQATLNLDVALYAHAPAYTCPSGKRAYILLIGKGITTGASCQQLKIGGVEINIEAILTAVSIDSYDGTLWLEAGDSLGLRGTDNIGDTARTCDYMVVEVTR